MYQLVTDWWYDFVKMPPVYQKINQMIYMYFPSATLVATGVWSRTFDAIWFAEHPVQAVQDLPTVLVVSQWGTRHHNFHDNRIWRPETEMSMLTRPWIGPLSQRVENLWNHWNKVAMVAREPRADHHLRALHRIEEIDWDNTFTDAEKTGFGRWLPYSFETVEVDHPVSCFFGVAIRRCILRSSVRFVILFLCCVQTRCDACDVGIFSNVDFCLSRYSGYSWEAYFGRR